MSVQFSKELRDDVAGGDITVTFRLWRRAQVKVGGRGGRESLRSRAAHAGLIADGTLLRRIALHVVG